MSEIDLLENNFQEGLIELENESILKQVYDLDTEILANLIDEKSISFPGDEPKPFWTLTIWSKVISK